MFQEEDRDQVRRRQSERAIQLAMATRWEDAVQANRSIIKLFPNDADSYNRLGKALMELSRFPAAKKAYKRALELDGANQIAKKNLERLTVRAKLGGQAEAAGRPLEAGGSSGPGAAVLAGIATVVAAGAVALGGAAWWARRRA